VAKQCPDNPAKAAAAPPGPAVAAGAGADQWTTVNAKLPHEQRKKADAKAKEDKQAKQAEEQRVKEAEELKAKRALERQAKAAEEEKKMREEEKRREQELARAKVEEAERKAREAEELARQKERTKQLRHENQNPKTPDRNFFKTLNSKANKCAVFPKKLSTLTRENFPTILKEFDTLNLSRYVAELVTHIVEAPLKNADVFSMAEMCSAIHARYHPEFAEALTPALVAQFEGNDPAKVGGDNADVELIATVTRRRTALRLLTELFICGLESNLGIVQSCVSDLIKRDPLRKDGTVYNLMMLLSFVRRAAGPILGIVSEGGEKPEVIVEPEKANRFHSVFDKYFDGVCEYLTEEYKKMKKAERWNKEQLRTKGVISDKGKEQYEERRAVFEKLLQNVQQFAEALQREVPKMIEEKIDTIEEIGTEVVSTQTQLTEQEVNSLWPDEEIRSFYEDLPDLTGKVPAVLLGMDKAAAVATAPTAEAGSAAESEGSVAAVASTEGEKPLESSSAETAVLSAADEAELETAGAEEENAPKPKTPLDVFMVSLSECFSRRKADEAAEEFASTFGDKKGRNRLVEVLFNCPRTKLELIPRYCRIAATLDQYPVFKDICPQLVKKLDSQFFYLLKKKNQLTLEGKLRNIRFLGELVNFRVCPADVIFRIFGKLLDEFVHHNVEVSVLMLEVCGRFMYRSPLTHVRMRVALDRMLRLKENKTLDERLITSIENAYFHCNPPETPAIHRKERSPVQQYIRWLVFRDMDLKLRQETFEHLRRLPWRDPAIEEYCVKCFLKLSRGKFGTIPHLASIVAQLAPFHESFCTRVVDGLLEHTRLCLEDKRGSEPQHQVMNMRFLGELFLCQVVDSRLVFDVLYTTIFFGVPDPNRTEDSFRVRLVCTLLDCVAKPLAIGSGATRLEIFIQYFQRYVLALKFVQLDLHFALNDTLERLPVKVPKFRSLSEAAQAIRKLEGAPEVDLEQLKRDRERLEQEREQQVSEEAKRKAAEEKRRAFFEEKKRREEEDKKTFDRELALLMSERPAQTGSSSSSAGKGLRSGIPAALLQKSSSTVVEVTEDGELPKEDSPAPGNAASAAAREEDDYDDDSDEGEDSGSEEADETPPAKDPEFDRSATPFRAVTFKVLLRKGAKIQARDLSIPEDNVLAVRVKERQTAEEREREEMKGLVLQKARLVDDAPDELTGNQRLNRTGMNIKKQQMAEAAAAKPSGPPTRALGRKY
jgi:regulator of nonsense transcripts 2